MLFLYTNTLKYVSNQVKISIHYLSSWMKASVKHHSCLLRGAMMIVAGQTEYLESVRLSYVKMKGTRS
jgi:pyruvate formate-lyase activating enzyme-like uncharacterized protein